MRKKQRHTHREGLTLVKRQLVGFDTLMHSQTTMTSYYQFGLCLCLYLCDSPMYRDSTVGLEAALHYRHIRKSLNTCLERHYLRLCNDFMISFYSCHSIPTANKLVRQTTIQLLCISVLADDVRMPVGILLRPTGFLTLFRRSTVVIAGPTFCWMSGLAFDSNEWQ